MDAVVVQPLDVQPVDPIELWESPPFEPTIRDGKLFARGAADNKAQIALRLATIRAFGDQMPVTVRWVIEREEEVGSPNFERDRSSDIAPAVRYFAALLKELGAPSVLP